MQLMMLGDLGEDVVKIEKLGNGDVFRQMTLFNSWVGDAESPCFLAWNRNKRSIALDIKSAAGKEIIFKLARGRIFVGEAGATMDLADASRLLTSRSLRRELELDPALPPETRRWAAFQHAGGGSWGGCMLDVDAIVETVAPGMETGVK